MIKPIGPCYLRDYGPQYGASRVRCQWGAKPQPETGRPPGSQLAGHSSEDASSLSRCPGRRLAGGSCAPATANSGLVAGVTPPPPPPPPVDGHGGPPSTVVPQDGIYMAGAEVARRDSASTVSDAGRVGGKMGSSPSHGSGGGP